jgi:hypothetical protein
VNYSAVILIHNKKYLRNFWIYSVKGGINFSSNFVDLIPGSHQFIIEFKETPKMEDFNFKWM